MIARPQKTNNVRSRRPCSGGHATVLPNSTQGQSAQYQLMMNVGVIAPIGRFQRSLTCKSNVIKALALFAKSTAQPSNPHRLYTQKQRA